MAIGILLMSILIAELLFYTWCRVQCVSIGYGISKAAENHRRLLTLQNNYRVELARLKSPERIAKIARNKLGLKAPTADQVIIIP